MVTFRRREVMLMTSFESLSLLMQLATVMFAGFSIAVTMIVLFINKK